MTEVHGLGRRSLLALSGAMAAGWTLPARAQARAVSDRLCIADAAVLHKLSPALLRRTLAMFQGVGFGTIRSGFGRIGTDPARGGDTGRRLDFVRQAVEAGFRLKLQIGTWSGVPDQFERDHPDARIVNGRGESPPPGYLSPWYPGLKPLLAQEAATFFGYLRDTGLMGAVTTLIADLGPAGEPIYPAGWIVHRDPRDATFWFYDPHAQAAFGRDMQRRHSNDLRRANQAWGTQFPAWEAVRIPEPGTRPGPMWQDVLTWYRDAKREVIRFQVQTARAEIARAYAGRPAPQLVLLVPGSHLKPDAIPHAVQSGDGEYGVKLMIDTEWLLELARSEGCAVQHTAAQNEQEIRYLSGILRAQGGTVPLWAENAMGKPALDPGHLADVVLNNGLFGLDYISAASVLQPDGVTPNEVMPRLADACARMLQRLPTRAGR